jgi:hypothetical protein
MAYFATISHLLLDLYRAIFSYPMRKHSKNAVIIPFYTSILANNVPLCNSAGAKKAAFQPVKADLPLYLAKIWALIFPVWKKIKKMLNNT